MTYRAVRTPGWLYVRYHGGDRELYDPTPGIPQEMRSRHYDPRLPGRPAACWRGSFGGSSAAAASNAAGPRPLIPRPRWRGRRHETTP